MKLYTTIALLLLILGTPIVLADRAYDKTDFNTSDTLTGDPTTLNPYSNAFDSNIGTFFQDADEPEGNPSFVVLRLNNQSAFIANRVVINFFDASYNADSYEIYGGNDGDFTNATEGNWTFLGEETNDVATSDVSFNNNDTYNFYLINMTTVTTPALPAIKEIMVYNPASTSIFQYEKSFFNVSDTLTGDPTTLNPYSNAFDDDYVSTFFQDADEPEGNPSFVVLRLNNQSAFNADNIRIFFFDASYNADSYEIYGGNDGDFTNATEGNWTFLGEETNDVATSDVSFNNNDTYNFYLINMTTVTTPALPAIKEIEVYSTIYEISNITSSISIDYFAIPEGAINYSNYPIVNYYYEVNYTILGEENFTCSITCDGNTTVNTTPFTNDKNNFISSPYTNCATPGNHTLEIANCTSDDTSVSYYNLSSTNFTINEPPEEPERSEVFNWLIGGLTFLILALYIIYRLATQEIKSFMDIIDVVIAFVILSVGAMMLL